jgi:hypothetical protein
MSTYKKQKIDDSIKQCITNAKYTNDGASIITHIENDVAIYNLVEMEKYNIGNFKLVAKNLYKFTPVTRNDILKECTYYIPKNTFGDPSYFRFGTDGKFYKGLTIQDDNKLNGKGDIYYSSVILHSDSKILNNYLSKYEGDIKDGNPDGNGKMIFSTFSYIHDLRRPYNTNDHKKSPHEYDGQWKNGLMHGKGVMKYFSGGHFVPSNIESVSGYYDNIFVPFNTFEMFDGMWENGFPTTGVLTKVNSETGEKRVISETGEKTVISETGEKTVISETGEKTVISETGENTVFSETVKRTVNKKKGGKSHNKTYKSGYKKIGGRKSRGDRRR